MSDRNLLTHAERELTIIGWLGSSEDTLSDTTARGLLKCVQAFADMRHSGLSAEITIPILNTLLQYRALSALTDDPDEWNDVSHMSGTPMWQNIRDSTAFSEDGGKTYYLLDEIPTGQYSDTAPRHSSVPKNIHSSRTVDKSARSVPLLE